MPLNVTLNTSPYGQCSHSLQYTATHAVTLPQGLHSRHNGIVIYPLTSCLQLFKLPVTPYTSLTCSVMYGTMLYWNWQTFPESIQSYVEGGTILK